MRKANNKDAYRRVVSLLAELVLVGLYTAGFAYVWYTQYSNAIDAPFYRRGNWVTILIYVVLVLLFGRAFGGMKIGYLRRSDMFYSQLLSILCVNVLSYFQISLINRDFLPPLPMFFLTIADLILLPLWIFGSSKVYFLFYPPRRLVVVYGDRSAADLIVKMSRRVEKYMICEALQVDVSIWEIEETIKRYEGVILCEVSGKRRNDLIKFCFSENIRMYIAPKISDIILRGAEEIRLFDTPLLLCRNYGLAIEQRFAKRLFDLVFSIFLLVLLSPLMLCCALAIKLEDGGPVLFQQERLTMYGRRFTLNKFRSMVINAEENGPQLATDEDARITKVGRFLRRFRLDELPQLFNIMVGDMSVVGPRPERPELAEEYEKTMPEFSFRLQAKAGLTGYAQVIGLYDTEPYDKLKMDLMYIEKYSVLLDLQILLMTLRTILFPRQTNASEQKRDSALERKLEEKMEGEEDFRHAQKPRKET